MGWKGSGEYSPSIEPPIDRSPDPGVERLMVYIVVADDLAVCGCSVGGRGRLGMSGTGLGDRDRSRVMALPGVAIVSPGE